MIYSCDECRFLFVSEEDVKQCPDCGKHRVRPANEQEIEEFTNRKSEEQM